MQNKSSAFDVIKRVKPAKLHLRKPSVLSLSGVLRGGEGAVGLEEITKLQQDRNNLHSLEEWPDYDGIRDEERLRRSLGVDVAGATFLT